jgi:hypothetical protein
VLFRWPVSLTLAFFVASICACAQGTGFRGQIKTVPSPELKLSWARATRTSTGILVWGQIQQVNCCVQYLPGQVHLEAKDSGGLIVATKEVPWGEFIARQLHSASFKALLPLRQGVAISTIELRFDVFGRS